MSSPSSISSGRAGTLACVLCALGGTSLAALWVLPAAPGALRAPPAMPHADTRPFAHPRPLAHLIATPPAPCAPHSWSEPPVLLAIEQDATGQRRAVLLVSDRGPSLAASGGLHATYRLAAGQGPATPDDHDTHRWYVASVAVDHVQLKRVSPPTDTTSDTSLTLWLGPPPSGGAPVDATERAP